MLILAGRPRSGRSELYNSIPMVREQREAARKGQERAALLKKEQEAVLSATKTNTATAAAAAAVGGGAAAGTGTGGGGATIALVQIKGASATGRQKMSKDNKHGASADGGASGSGAAGVRRVREKSVATKKKKNSTSGGSGGAGGVERQAGSRGGDGTSSGVTGGKSSSAAKRRRKRRKRGVPIGRAEAVELLRRTVTNFRAAQVGGSSAAGSVGGGGGGVEGGGEGGSTGGDVLLSLSPGGEREGDAGTIAAQEFAEIARRCLGSDLPEIALEVRGGGEDRSIYIFCFWRLFSAGRGLGGGGLLV